MGEIHIYLSFFSRFKSSFDMCQILIVISYKKNFVLIILHRHVKGNVSVIVVGTFV